LGVAGAFALLAGVCAGLFLLFAILPNKMWLVQKKSYPTESS